MSDCTNEYILEIENRKDQYQIDEDRARENGKLPKFLSV
jgi:hypothetical protein